MRTVKRPFVLLATIFTVGLLSNNVYSVAAVQTEADFMVPMSTAPQKVEYTSSRLRNPFALPAAAREAGVGSHIVAGNFTAESLRLLGTFIHGDGQKKWAFIISSDGQIHKIILGSVVGSGQAVVTAITNTHVTLTEADGQQKKTITLNVKEPQ